MNRNIALTLSIVFQPLLVPTLVFTLILYLVPQATQVPHEIKGSMLLMVVVSTLLIPMLSVIGMKYMESIPSLHMASKRERYLPFTMVSIFYVIVTYFFYLRLNYDDLIVFSLVTMTGSIVLLTLVTFFWKISAHLTGLSGLLAIMVVLSWKYPSASLLYPMIVTIMLCGAVASSRLYLNAHKPGELLAGFCLGFGTCFVSFYYYLLS
ncbi:PA-phosphatase [Echinicola sp. 20G]|uniref:PA-phosphatase n=1 Tax=Echinicola sp. 20G TaxID=2781961 RepID=UPI0019111040|nr:PA-phosphatase [Echinicola sp. 20G]